MGLYRTQGTTILGRDDKVFVPVGANMATFNSDGGLGSGNKTAQQVSADAFKHWNMNTVRLVAYVTDRNSWAQRAKTTGYNGKPAGLASVVEIMREAIDMYRANGIVAMPEAHDFTTAMGGTETQAQIDGWFAQVKEWWIELAKLYKNDDGVWFNLLNEPAFINAEYHDKQLELARAIRAIAPNNIIVIDAPRWGQDIPTTGQTLGYDPAMVPDIQAKIGGNLVYSMHHYGSNNGWYGTEQSFNTYMDKVQTAGLPLLIGEIGWPRAQGWDTSYSNCRNGGILAMQECPRRNIGILWWAGAHNDQYDLHYDPSTNTSCEIWDTKTTNIPLSDGGLKFRRYTDRMVGKLPTFNYIDPKGLGKVLKSTLTANTDGAADAIKALGGGVIPRNQLTNKSASSAVLPYLPPQSPVPGGKVRSQTRIFFDASTAYPIRATWTEDTTLKVVIQNPATSGSDLNIGYGVYGTDNHTTEPDVVPPGSEWVGYASPLPVYVRFATSTVTGYVDVLTERSA